MLLIRKNGATSNILRLTLRNSSTGQGLTGLTSASSGLIVSTIADNEAAATTYTAAGSTVETIATLGTFAAPTATKCRFKEVDATNHPGLYEIQFADARFAVSSAKTLRVTISGATSLLNKNAVVQLTASDVDDAVRLGLTALPNAAAAASGGLPTVGTGSGQVNPDGTGALPVAMGTTLAANPTANTTGEALFYASMKLGRRGTAQAGAATTITLDSGASAVNDAFKDHFIKITSGTGSGQFATITGYVGSTKVATISRPISGGAWSTNPDSTSVFAIEPFPAVDLMAVQSFNNSGQTTNLPADLQTIKTQTVTAAAGVTFPASIGTSTYAGADTSGTTTLLSRIGGSITISGGKVAATVATGDDADAAAIKTTIGVAGAGLTAVTAATVGDKTGYSLTQSFPSNFSSLAITGGGAVTAGTVSDKTGYSLSVTPPTSAVIAAAVWDLATSGHTTSSTFGAAMNAAGSAGDPWATALPGSYGSGTAGNIVGNRIDAAVSAVPAAVWASGTRTLSAFAFSVTAATVSDKTGYSLAAAGLDSIAATAPTHGTLGSWTFPQMLMWLVRRLRNKVTRSTSQIVVLADDATTVVTTQAISDDGAGNEVQGAAT